MKIIRKPKTFADASRAFLKRLERSERYILLDYEKLEEKFALSLLRRVQCLAILISVAAIVISLVSLLK